MPKALLLSRQPLAARPLQDWLDRTAEEIVLLTTPGAVADAGATLAGYFPQHRLVDDYHAWSTEQAAEEAALEHGAELVASTSESDVLRAARLRERLGLPGQSVASALAYRDKVVMKEQVRRAGLKVPAFTPVDSPADLLDFVAAEGFPVVVKPRLGAGAEDVSILRGPADLTAFFDRQRTSDVPYLPGQWMAEAFQTGEFFHVDGIMRDGRIVHAWPARYSGGLAERLHDQLHIGSVLLDPDDPEAAVLRQMAADVVAALPAAPHPLAFHLEAWLDSEGEPVLCEIASRAGGALIAEAYARAFGVQLAKEGLRAQCGAELTLDAQPAAPSAAVGWVLLPPGHGTFVPPAGPCPVPGAEVTLLLEAGARSRGVEHVSDAAATVFVTADSARTVQRLLAEAMDWWHMNAAWTDPTDATSPTSPTALTSLTSLTEELSEREKDPMTSSEHVLVVGPGRDFPARIRGARPGTRTTVICQLDYVGKVRDPGANARVLGIRSDAPDQEWIDLAAAAHARDPFTRIGTFGERDQDHYAVIADALGLPAHTPRTVTLVHDKEAMRVRLREAGVDTTACARVDDVDRLRAFVREHGTPCVVKPVSSSGSAGVTKISDEGQLAEAFERAADSYLGLSNTGVLVEEFLEGPQFSVEAFSEAGEHTMVAITRKYSDPQSFVELGHVAPADLPDVDTKAIHDYVPGILDALGITFGPTHTEVILTAKGPRLIETHVRMGGDMIPTLALEATGVDIDDCTARQTLGEQVLPAIKDTLEAAARGPQRDCSAIWFAALDAPGTLEEVHGLKEARALPGVTEADLMLRPGAKVGTLESSVSRVAYARASAPTQEEAVRAARAAVAALEFQLRVSGREADTV
ncbi:ATP-grasp domain-containing protein [Streptomyces sp. NPDC021093]|uniref:ATP-grasp domain-containing protein n=1 Tax=Streptomyces sp. NPDC021093 TaxID=3365112 RepID=UPI0037AC8995